ncbi:MAG: peptidoglycan DD-metalloendopeptidase family protein [Clostridiales Family XIII bacterium]|jgi:murein DD-endopeptidase MepM/ murein hydrolase activator NlpD|nr:peptidoglycan DD-metalloendopeptidase family protein [Clostridiales Family XIII bacterium]
MRRPISIFLSIMLVFSLAASTAAWADEETDLKAARDKISKTKAEIKVTKQKETELGNRIAELNKNIKQKEDEIKRLETEIARTRESIQVVEGELAAALADIETQNEDLDARLRAMYMNGEMGVLDIILTSADISEFMATLDIVKKIHESDVKLLESMEDKYTVIDAKRGELKSLEMDLESKEAAQKTQRSAIQADKDAVAKAKLETEEYLKKLSKQLDEETAEANRISDEIRKKQSAAQYVGGEMSWPVPGYYTISSPFGNRLHPLLKVKKMHTGIDIPAPAGTKVLAANSGTVIMAGWNNSYGNVVMIDHGGKKVTLYAHNSSLAVKEGQKVTKGDVIAYVGTTGSSTGNHCHFEVRENGDYKNPMNYLTKK